MIWLIIAVSIILNLIWFVPGYAYGAGESGIPFFNTHWHFIATSYAWKSSLLGDLVGTSVAGAPTNWFLWFVESAFRSTAVVQMLVFTSIFIVSGISIYLMTKELFPKLNNFYCFIAAAFYWFNPFSLVNIWNRFINNYLVFFAFLPLAFYTFMKALKSKKLIYLLYLGIFNLIFSFVFTSIPFVIILWSVYFYIFVFYFFIENEAKDRGTTLGFFVINFVLFICLNSWWILQEFNLTTSGGLDQTFSAFFTTLGNLNTLQVLSNQLGLITNLFRFTHRTFFVDTNLFWKQVYNSAPIALLGFLIPGLILRGFVKHRHNKGVLFLIIIFFIGIFTSKGIAEPLSEPFYFSFTKLSILQVFRNPFEKLGILSTLAAGPLLAFSLNYLQKATQFVWLKRIIFFASIFLIFVVWAFPFWTGLVFSGTDPHQNDEVRSYKLQIPNYYSEANEYLKNKNDIFRFLMLPLGGEGNTYTWPFSYSGIDLSASIFEIPNIAFNTTIPLYNQVVASLEKDFFIYDDFYRATALLNIDYFMLRNDIDWQYRSMTNPDLVLKRLKQLSFVSEERGFGKLDLYRIDNNKTLPKIYSPETTVKVYPHEELSDIFSTHTPLDTALISGSAPIDANVTLIKPIQTLYLTKQKKYSYEEAKSQLLYAKNLPAEPAYILSLIKEKAERLAITEPNGLFIFDITHLGKRIMEIDAMDESGTDINTIDSYLTNYFSTLSSLESTYPDQFKSSPSNASWNLLTNELSKHETILENLIVNNINQRKEVYTRALQKFNSERKKIGIVTYNDSLLVQEEGKNYWVYRFDIPSAGIYFLNLENSVTQLQINSMLLNPGTNLNLSLEKGISELFVPDPDSDNLINSEEVGLDSSTASSITRGTSSFEPYSEYMISFDYWIKKGRNFSFSLNYDNDTTTNGNIIPGFSQTISSDQYNNDFRNQTIYFTPRNGSNRMSIGFHADNENDCELQRTVLSPSCSDPSFFRLFDKKTEVIIKNIRLQKVYKNDIFLSLENKTDLHLPQISFEKINPATYQVHVSNSDGPFILVFSELYNPGWVILDGNGNKINALHIRTNGYSNAWKISNTGNFDLRLYYSPQDFLSLGIKISLVSTLVVVLGIALLLWREKIKQ